MKKRKRKRGGGEGGKGETPRENGKGWDGVG